MNGWRIDMEDKVLVEYDASADFGVFGVFDGHGDGGHASDYVAKNLWGKLTSNPSGRRRTAHATPTSSPRRSYRPVVIWTKVSWGG